MRTSTVVKETMYVKKKMSNSTHINYMVSDQQSTKMETEQIVKTIIEHTAVYSWQYKNSLFIHRHFNKSLYVPDTSIFTRWCVTVTYALDKAAAQFSTHRWKERRSKKSVVVCIQHTLEDIGWQNQHSLLGTCLFFLCAVGIKTEEKVTVMVI
jgi:hypothetical protein